MKNIILLAAMLVAAACQAQTCKISANQHNGKVIQISVNLDSLKGQTLITTINQQQDGNVNVQMAYEDEGGSAVTPCEDSSAAANLNENTDNLAANAESKGEKDTFTEVTEPEPESEPAQDAPADDVKDGDNTILNAVGGVGDVVSLLSSFTRTNGEPYAEYYAKKLTEADTTKYQPTYGKRKWKWLKNYKSYPTLELSGIFGKDFSQNDDSQEAEAISEDDYGTDTENSFNFGGSARFSQVFVKGRYDENGKFIPNPLNFAWSIGGMFAMDYQKDFGWSYDWLAKVGIQAGTGITLGVDALIGCGITPYAIYSTNYIDYRVINHNQFCFKYGLRAWLSMNYGGNTYTTINAQIVKSVAPSSVYDHPTGNGWENTFIEFDEGSWQVGFAVGYKFGHYTEVTDRRLIASLSTGLNLIGKDHASEMLIELEKYNNISPKTDFIYGLGYGTTFGKNKMSSFVLQVGWRKYFSSKFSGLAKIYAGLGEYMIEKYVEDSEHRFHMKNSAVKQLSMKAGLQLGASYRFGCVNLNASLRGGYHFAPEPSTEGYTKVECSGLKGFELMPIIGASVNF